MTTENKTTQTNEPAIAVEPVLCNVINKKCTVTVSIKDKLFIDGVYYTKCDRKAKYKITYKSNGKLNEDFVCGLHLQSAKKLHERLLKRCKYDDQLKYDAL
jgi:hypothetical protein